jgi:hypothetical protein
LRLVASTSKMSGFALVFVGFLGSNVGFHQTF